MISITNVRYFTEGHDMTGIDLPTEFTVPSATIRGLTHEPTIGDRLTKAIEGDWLVRGFDYERPGDDAPTPYRDPWIGSPDHLAITAQPVAQSV